MRLMGLVWTKASSHIIRSAMDDVVRRQKPDGGWSQLDSLPTDAYATGMSLYALHEAGISVTDPVYRSGIEFLLKNQYADGSWLVKSRAYPVQPYFESWISVWPASVDLRCWLELGVVSDRPHVAQFQQNGKTLSGSGPRRTKIAQVGPNLRPPPPGRGFTSASR